MGYFHSSKVYSFFSSFYHDFISSFMGIILLYYIISPGLLDLDDISFKLRMTHYYGIYSFSEYIPIFEIAEI
jgi:hypothetical protein